MYILVDFSWHVAIGSFNMENIVNQQRKMQLAHEHSTSIICTLINVMSYYYIL